MDLGLLLSGDTEPNEELKHARGQENGDRGSGQQKWVLKSTTRPSPPSFSSSPNHSQSRTTHAPKTPLSFNFPPYQPQATSSPPIFREPPQIREPSRPFVNEPNSDSQFFTKVSSICIG